MTRSSAWVPDRQEIIWIDFNPQVGREMRNMHPMLVLSPKSFNAKTSIVIGFPMSTASYNASNPFAVNNSKSAKETSYIICNQPKSFDWREREAKPHPWRRVSDVVFREACLGLNDIIELTDP
jgi:mRNA interferase MazF